jgi:transketolase
VRDISALSAMPGMTLIEPYCEAEVGLALDWAVREAPGPVYIRLVSVPWELGFAPPAAERVEPGRGTVLREGEDALLVATGPVMVSQAVGAAELLADREIAAGVVALPWLRDIDGEWLAERANGAPVFSIDNHYATGGQGDAVLSALAAADNAPVSAVRKLGVESVPACGTNDEILRAHRLDAAHVAERVASLARVSV